MLTSQSISTLFDRADGASLTESALMWVFDFSNGAGQRRDLRFWLPEIQAKAGLLQGCGENEFERYELATVIARILPKSRANFHAGEVDQLFQIRPRTRIDFTELNGAMKSGRNFYSRLALANFLRNRWLGLRTFPRAAATTPADTNKQTTHAGQTLTTVPASQATQQNQAASTSNLTAPKSPTGAITLQL